MSAGDPPGERAPLDWGPRRALVSALVVALTLPSVLASLYFLILAGEGGGPSRIQQVTYSGGKVVQFAFPLVFLFFVTGSWPRMGRPAAAGLALGLGFGVAVALAMFGLYFLVLRDTPLFAESPTRIRHKLEEFGVASPAGYLGLAAVLTVVHSLLEEYYWRWFVFGGLRRLMTLGPAVAVSSLGFMAHHVIVLYVYLPGYFLTAVVPFSLAIAVGGACWAWIYERTRSLIAPWLSHLLVDAAIFVIGWDLVMRGS
jgi:membrane protease YdiL (CAAX protease family)